MKNEITSLNSDAVNRYKTRFTAGALESALRQKWRTGTPCSLGHDQTRPFGWMRPISLYFEPRLTRLMGVFTYPETDAESDMLSTTRYQYLREDQLSRCQPFEADLRARIGSQLSGDAKLVDAGVPSFYDEDLAVRCFPKLFEASDKDGLVRLNSLKHLGDGTFDANGLALFGHMLFRRSAFLLNHVNHHFFNTVDHVKSTVGDVLVALDRNLVGWSAAYQNYMELEYWWGPKFHEDLASIPTGVTTHGVSNEFDRLYSGILRTEFWWQSRKGEHILEVEELKNAPSADGDYHCRYLHCIVNEATGTVLHLDGSVRTYTEAMMSERIDQSINSAGRDTRYTKLWRIDHPLEISAWKRLVSDYFLGNHLVGEYLGAEPEPQRTRPQTAREVRQTLSPKARWVPYTIEHGSGVRVNVSYHAADARTQARRVQPIDTISVGDDSFVVVSLFTLELQKMLRRAGQDLFIPPDVRFLACEDLYVNFPVIVHESFAYVRDTLEAVFEYLKWSEQARHDRAVSLTIAYPLDDREVQISVYGHSLDLIQNWAAVFGTLPRSNAEVVNYANRLADVMQRFPASIQPVPTEIIRPTGVLWLNRKMVPPDVGGKTVYNNAAKQLEVWLPTPFAEGHTDLEIGLKSGVLSIRICMIADSVSCTNCGESYFSCPCSIVYDNAGKIMEKFTPAGLVITDRPA